MITSYNFQFFLSRPSSRLYNLKRGRRCAWVKDISSYYYNTNVYVSEYHSTIYWKVLSLYSQVVIQKTRTVRVRVPYPHCTGAARTQIVDSMDTNTLRDTQKILKKIFFSKFFWLTCIYIPHLFSNLEIKLIFIVFWVLVWVWVHLETLKK